MNPRVTLAALIALVALAGVVWYTEFRDQGAGNTAAATAEKPDLLVLKLDDRDTRQLEVVKGDRRVMAQRNEDDGWTLQPSGQPGDRVRITSALFRLASLNATRRVAEAPADLAQYGLDNPAISATLTQGDGSSYTLLLGGKPPTEQGTYLKRADDSTVYLVPNTLATDLERLVDQPPILQPTATPAPSPAPGG